LRSGLMGTSRVVESISSQDFFRLGYVGVRSLQLISPCSD
jgi:hypothetical protein